MGVSRRRAGRSAPPRSVVFQAVHSAVYREHGFTLLEVPPASPMVRADLVETWLSGRPGAGENRLRPAVRAVGPRPTDLAAAGLVDREDNPGDAP